MGESKQQIYFIKLISRFRTSGGEFGGLRLLPVIGGYNEPVAEKTMLGWFIMSPEIDQNAVFYDFKGRLTRNPAGWPRDQSPMESESPRPTDK